MDMINENFHGGHLGFQDGRQRQTFGIATIDFVDLILVDLDIKFKTLRHLEAEISTHIDFMPPFKFGILTFNPL